VRVKPVLRTALVLLATSVIASACAGAAEGTGSAAEVAGSTTTSTSTTAPVTVVPTVPVVIITTTSTLAPPSTTETTTTTTTTTTDTAAPTTSVDAADTTTTTIDPGPRVISTHPWGTPFATAIDVTLYYPATQVERIGFHEAGRTGSRQMDPLPDATRPITLETRNRGTGSRTAADIVIDPQSELRSPVTGTVIRSGTYILYCKYTDDFLVINPDDHPGWEVKMFHFQGLAVRPGDRVEAGVTFVGTNPAMLPFESQVNEFTANPSWPHVHIEVIDPSIPNKPSSGGGC